MKISKVKKLDCVEQAVITIGGKKITVSQDCDDKETLNIWSEVGEILKVHPIACNAVCISLEADKEPSRED